MFYSCNNCKSTNPEGKISYGMFSGSFYLMPSNDTGSKETMNLNVSLKKSAMNQAGNLVSELESNQNWAVLLNGKVIHPEFVFPELSNTMNPHYNLIMPIELPKKYWKNDNNSLSLVFRGSKEAFNAMADEKSVECFIKTYYPN